MRFQDIEPFMHLIRETCDFDELIGSLVTSGVKVPLVVDPDGRLLRGYRRFYAIESVRKTAPHDYNRLFSDVPTAVEEPRSEKEQWITRLESRDEGELPLAPWEECLAIDKLLGVGCTQEQCATVLGLMDKQGRPRREYVRLRGNIFRLPEHLRQEYRKLLVSGREATTYRLGNVPSLVGKYT